ncbi:phage holin family protein [Saccharibacillus brassicae]|uniref:Phage holin family protein n=1 Tax=Saccharibacillus brassicae TaxID=2583377 RepID=A0A4Y6UR65_SACBS|nr:phage holin family protein [Saccharibacillus brassicae]QDH19554.1 phage holin family protein [Saccharibacillus brassicae]
MNDLPTKLLANRDYSTLYALSGVFGSITSYAFGGWSGLLEILLLFFAVDYLSGMFASIKTGKGLKSSVGFWGLLKKGLMMLMVLLGHRIDLALGLNIVMNGTIFFWLSNEAVSIIENYGRLGLKLPPVFRKMITILQEKSGENEVIKEVQSTTIETVKVEQTQTVEKKAE